MNEGQEFLKYATKHVGLNSMHVGHFIESSMTPYIIEERPMNMTQMDVFSRLMMDRIIFLGTGINDQVANIINAQLLFLESENPDKDIHLYINSPGGSVTSGLSIYDTMQFIKSPVHTIVMGQACSMGSFLAQAGEAGHRMMLPHARHMIHQPSGGARGQATDMLIQVEEILAMKKSLTQIYVDHNSAGKTFEQLSSDMERDFFMSASEAVAYGRADNLVQKRNMS